jgi:hypothetical protein
VGIGSLFLDAALGAELGDFVDVLGGESMGVSGAAVRVWGRLAAETTNGRPMSGRP